MYLIISPRQTYIHYSIFTPDDANPLFTGKHEFKESSSKGINSELRDHLLPQLRNQGKIVTHIGIVLPFSPREYAKPIPAQKKLLQTFGTTELRKKVLMSATALFELLENAWPHVPKYFLFDTHLSQSLDRTQSPLALPYDVTHESEFLPVLLGGYGHCANVMALKGTKTVISLVIDDQTSAALFEGSLLKDALPSLSPLSTLQSLQSAGAIDSGLSIELLEKKKYRAVEEIFYGKAGVLSAVGADCSIDELLEIAGIVPRKDIDKLANLSIETIEWIEISLKSFIRSLRHAIGALATSDVEAKLLVVSSSTIPADSPFWSLLTKGSLSHLKIHVSEVSPLLPARDDLLAYLG